jgi:hypothetical protein
MDFSSNGRTAPRRSAELPNRVYAWAPRDTIPLGASRTLRVVKIRRAPPVEAFADREVLARATADTLSCSGVHTAGRALV